MQAYPCNQAPQLASSKPKGLKIVSHFTILYHTILHLKRNGGVNVSPKTMRKTRTLRQIQMHRYCTYPDRHRERWTLYLFIQEGNKLALLTRDFWLTRSSSAVINSSVMQLTVGSFFKIFFIVCMLERAPLISL